MPKQLKPTQFLIYQIENQIVKVDVLIQDETVWLTQKQMAELFDKDRSVITKHINNVFKERELEEKSNVQILISLLSFIILMSLSQSAIE